MAEINLLQKTSSSPTFSFGHLLTSVVVKVIFLVFLAAVGYYGYLFYQVKSTTSQILNVQNDIKKKQDEIRKFEQRDEILTRQGQVKELKELYRTQPVWSRFLPELARFTLRSATFLSINAQAVDGKVNFAAQVPGYAELDKFLGVFDLPEYNRCIADLKLNSISKVQAEDTFETKFDVTLKVAPTLFASKQDTDNASSSTISAICK